MIDRRKKVEDMTEEEYRETIKKLEADYKPLAERMKEQKFESIPSGIKYTDTSMCFSGKENVKLDSDDDITFFKALGFSDEEIAEMERKGEIVDGKYVGKP